MCLWAYQRCRISGMQTIGCAAGELYDQIQRKEQLTLAEARFYASEIVDILAYLRKEQVLAHLCARGNVAPLRTAYPHGVVWSRQETCIFTTLCCSQ